MTQQPDETLVPSVESLFNLGQTPVKIKKWYLGDGLPVEVEVLQDLGSMVVVLINETNKKRTTYHKFLFGSEREALEYLIDDIEQCSNFAPVHAELYTMAKDRLNAL